MANGAFAHFHLAQAPVYGQALGELQDGAKRSHWMWFVFPQLVGLGHSAMAQKFALADLAAARAYLSDPVLAGRLRQCTQAVLGHAPGSAAPRSLAQLFGAPDDQKFWSSMTLFSLAAPEEPLFTQALAAFFDGKPDPGTQRLLRG